MYFKNTLNSCGKGAEIHIIDQNILKQRHGSLLLKYWKEHGILGRSKSVTPTPPPPLQFVQSQEISISQLGYICFSNELIMNIFMNMYNSHGKERSTVEILSGGGGVKPLVFSIISQGLHKF